MQIPVFTFGLKIKKKAISNAFFKELNQQIDQSRFSKTDIKERFNQEKEAYLAILTNLETNCLNLCEAWRRLLHVEDKDEVRPLSYRCAVYGLKEHLATKEKELNIKFSALEFNDEALEKIREGNVPAFNIDEPGLEKINEAISYFKDNDIDFFSWEVKNSGRCMRYLVCTILIHQ